MAEPEKNSDSLSRDGESASDGRKPLVLVVEDHEDTRFLITYLLGVRGCDVRVAENGEEAIHMAEAMRPGLVLMDINLPRMNGLAATRRMRQIAALKSVPVIFLSGYADASSRAEALAEGGDDYLVKPFALAEFERILERYIGKSGGH
ncbi:MAG TPA: response regulator [Pyrinomonadaceae bacterium]|nr:response regulator [Pyrinomonadaceae bacterium]